MLQRLSIDEIAKFTKDGIGHEYGSNHSKQDIRILLGYCADFINRKDHSDPLIRVNCKPDHLKEESVVDRLEGSLRGSSVNYVDRSIDKDGTDGHTDDYVREKMGFVEHLNLAHPTEGDVDQDAESTEPPRVDGLFRP
jgi:hypothetical protein